MLDCKIIDKILAFLEKINTAECEMLELIDPRTKYRKEKLLKGVRTTGSLYLTV
ncbi:MAG: hypothetical protein Pg6B_07390 [Candidatus Azobacteroides pseudotrichonymphae]|jgi:S-adenosylhomocysteine hydrolase|nr:adenosylhomocysteinase [Bacteroidales bacterium OttesenSCG-928-I14]GMO36247.1 MAG: hypothetical protein Pg6B_07390 [Candidatus Azobacteroides pseudotrichonymphae]